MMSLWSHRPHFMHLGLFAIAYVLGCGFAQLLAIVPGTGISIWPPSGLFIATLVLASRPSWAWWVLAGCVAELFSNLVWFHSPLLAAFLIYAGNALEAVVGASLVRLACKHPVRLESLQEVLAFVVLGAGIAPAVSATVGSATLAWFGMQSQTFTAAWPLWWIGDATGVLLVAPLALVVFQSWDGKPLLSAERWIEAVVLGLIFLGVAALSLSGYLPFAYIIMPPLLWAAVRFEFKGAAVTLALLALITAVFTISGASQFAGDPESQRHRQVMLQLFLAISAFSALIVAAISRQYQLALVTLRQSQQQLQQMIDALPVRVWSATPTGEPLYFNKRYQDYFRAVIPNFEPLRASHLGSLVQELAHPEDSPVVQLTLQRCLEAGNAAVMRFRCREKDGAFRWAECRVEPRRDGNGAIAEWYGVSIDIDDEMRAQDALRERERELSQLVNMVPAQIRRLTPQGEPTFFNKRLLDFFGLDNVASLDRPGMSRLAAAIGSLVHPDDATRLLEGVHRSLESGEPFFTKYRMLRADGAYRWVDGRGEPLRDESGAIVQWYVISIDIDDEVRAQQALRESERSLWQLIETLPVTIDCAGADGEPRYRSRQLREFLGHDLEQLDSPGKSRLVGTLHAGVHPDDLEAVKEDYAHSLATGEPYRRKHRLRRFDGEYLWVDTRAAPMRNAEGAIVQWNVACVDIDGEVRAQEELRLSRERLARASQAASLAELSASIAHEVNQPLAAVVANSHACERWLKAEPPNIERAQRTVERIIRDANAAADVVGRIRALFKQSTETRSLTIMSGVIEESRNLLAEEAMRHSVRMEVEVESNLPPVALDRVQIQQVLVNLIRNGIEAMDSGAGDRILGVRARRMGEMIQINISDSGRGIDDADRIFEAFFTTKDEGMGMGLAISRSIVESHGGRLWAEKKEPRGATFIFTLPVETRVAG
jgi:PAS domain S-box-containing protein